MNSVAAEEIDRWPRGEVQLLRPRMQALTLQIILRAVMGVTDPTRRDALRVALRRLLEMLADPKWTTPFVAIGSQKPRYFPPSRWRIADVDDLLFAEIGERHLINVTERQHILSLLMGTTHDDGSPMSDHELRDELLTLLELARKRLSDYLGASSAAGAAR